MGIRHCRHEAPAHMLEPVEVMGGGGDVYRHRNGKPILLPKPEWWIQGTCEYGNCVEFCCPVCRCNSGGGFGPVDCPCQNWIGYHDMRKAPVPVAVKPSLRGLRRRASA